MQLIIYLILALFVTQKTKAEIRFSADFECGSLGEVERIDPKTIEDFEGDENIEYFKVLTREDPANPHQKTAHRSRRWFYFLLSGVKGKTVCFDIDYNDSKRPMYSYDNEHFVRFSEEECPQLNGSITKFYNRDSVYIAYYEPYSNKRLEKKLQIWERHPYFKRFELGLSGEGRPIEALVLSQDPHSGLFPNESGELHFKKADKAKKNRLHTRKNPSERKPFELAFGKLN